jgi:hypothetical protein
MRLILLVCLFASCHVAQDEAGQAESAKDEIAELHVKLDSLMAKISHKDTVYIKDTLVQVVQQKTVDKTPKIERKKEEVVIPKVPVNDTLFYYYTNKKVSVKIHPWQDGERLLELFNLYGVKTFEAREIHKSYSLGLNLKFHPNGAVKEIHESFNPGASLYTYFAHMKFSSTNDPEVRIEGRMPDYTLQEKLKKDRPFFWDKKRFAWVQQEIVIEQELP